MSEQISIGVWKKISKKGTKYYGCSKPVEIGGVRYWVNVFKNSSEHPNSPDLDVVVQEVEEEKESW